MMEEVVAEEVVVAVEVAVAVDSKDDFDSSSERAFVLDDDEQAAVAVADDAVDAAAVDLKLGM